MKHVYLVRHCKATGQDSNAPLTVEGRKQAEWIADFFSNKNIDYIVSSPFERAIATIRPFSERINKEIHIESRLTERVLSLENIPDWMDKLKESYSNLNLKLLGGESSQEAMQRGIEVIHELFNREENNFIAVTHGNLMSLILKHFDNRVGFEDWKGLSNPDIYILIKLDECDEIQVERYDRGV